MIPPHGEKHSTRHEQHCLFYQISKHIAHRFVLPSIQCTLLPTNQEDVENSDHCHQYQQQHYLHLVYHNVHTDISAHRPHLLANWYLFCTTKMRTIDCRYRLAILSMVNCHEHIHIDESQQRIHDL